MKPIPEEHPLHRLFKGLVESTFCTEMGVCDPYLTDYIADLLVGFVHVDAMYVLQGAQGRPLEQIANLLEAALDCEQEANVSQGLRLHRHIGDFALFWSGLYPEFLHRQRGLAGKDQLLDYVTRGKRAYAVASDLASEDTQPPSSLLRRLSCEFEVCCHGLGLVRRGWAEIDPGAAGGSQGLVY